MSLLAGFQTDAASVTTVIPTYNRAQYIGGAISNILGQTLPPAQVIVVDDGSTDGTREVVAGFGSRVEYLPKPNGGKSSALNLGLRHATGEFIWICDDDDIAAPEALAKLVRALQDSPGCGFAFGEYDLFTTGEGGRMDRTRVNFPSVKPKNLYLTLMERSFILQEGLLVKRSCYDEVGAFDEGNTRSEDLDMMLRLARRYSGVKVDGILFHLRQHSGIRGTKDDPVAADRVIEGWVKSDRRIFDRIYATHELREFVPGLPPGSGLTDEQKVTALLQRACIMARKGIWTYAAQDLKQAGDTARGITKTKLNKAQTEVLRRVFDLFSYAPHTFEQAGEFQAALNAIKPARLQRQMRVAIVWSLPFTIGAARLHGHKENFYRFLGIYFQLATPSALLRTLFDASFFSAGLDLVRKRRNRGIAGARP